MKSNFVAALKKYAVFSGRSTRAEFWEFGLIAFCLILLAKFLDAVLRARGTFGPGDQWISGVSSLALLIPSIAVGVRRLHDTGRSGWWILVSLLPLMNIVLLVYYILDSQPGTNKYGPNPMGVNPPAAAPTAPPPAA